MDSCIARLCFCLLLGGLCGHLLPAQTAAPAECACCSGDYRQFDFWLGSWRVHAPGRPDSLLGYNQIDRIQDGCVLRENWQSVNEGYSGTSYNWYDGTNDQWHQQWIDNQGSSLQLAGGWDGQAMVLSSPASRAGPRQRISWTPAADGSVRQHWQQSHDGGRTWETLFDGIYIRRQ